MYGLLCQLFPGGVDWIQTGILVQIRIVGVNAVACRGCNDKQRHTRNGKVRSSEGMSRQISALKEQQKDRK